MSNTYWLHRISHEADVSYQLLENGLLSIGFSKLVHTEAVCSCIGTADRDAFEAALSGTVIAALRSRYSLYYFLCKFSKGDTIVVPQFNGKFAIYEAVGAPFPVTKLHEYYRDLPLNGYHIAPDGCIQTADEKNIDLGFVIPVNCRMAARNRAQYASSPLAARMKAHQTTLNISDLKYDIEEACAATQPINFHSNLIQSLLPGMLQQIEHDITPDKLERLIAWYLKKIGASSVTILPKLDKEISGKADADVMGIFEPLKLTVYVQAKNHCKETNEWAVEQINNYTEEKQESNDPDYDYQRWVITTADSYSNQAVQIAKEQHIRLINGSDFAAALLDAGISDIEEAF